MATTPLGAAASRSSVRDVVASLGYRRRDHRLDRELQSVVRACVLLAERGERLLGALRRPSRPRRRRRQPLGQAGSRRGSRPRPAGYPSRRGPRSCASDRTRPSALTRSPGRARCPPPSGRPSPREPDRQRGPAVGKGVGRERRRVNVARPAQPTVIEPSLVPSRLTSSPAVTSPGSSALAPPSPCSSETVKSSSSGPCAISASSAAPARPRPRFRCRRRSVVPSASTQSSSRTTWIRPSRGSYGLSRSRSQTMSRCAWRTTVGRGVATREAGTRTTTFPAASTAREPVPRFAHARTCARAASSCFGGRAIAVSSSKRPQTSRGSSSASDAHRRSVSAAPGKRSTTPRTRSQRDGDPVDPEPAELGRSHGDRELPRDEDRDRRDRCRSSARRP